MKKKVNVRREAQTILQAAAAAIKRGLVRQHEVGRGYHLGDLVKKVSELTKKSVSGRELIKAMRVWFRQNIARFNNRYVHVDVAQVGKFAGT